MGDNISIVGDNMITSLDVHWCKGIPSVLLWRMFRIVGDTFSNMEGITRIPKDVDYVWLMFLNLHFVVLFQNLLQ